ncbi:FAD:protein FMN transferase [Nocardioides sp. NPDC126508]
MKRYVGAVMGTSVSLALRGLHEDDEPAEAGWAAVMASLREADEVFSTYRADSWISRLGRGEIGVLDCPPEVGEVLDLGERARVESGGAFDVWRDGVLDPSGVVKGWAAQRAAVALGSLGRTDHCLSVGGDVVCSAADSAEPWRIGIEDPRDPAKVLAVVPVRRGAVASSGTAHRGAHIVDARTGRTADELAGVTVVAHDLVTADIAATTAFALGAEGADWLRDHRLTGLVVAGNGTVETIGTAPRPALRQMS